MAKHSIQAGKIRPVLVDDTDPPVKLYVKMKWGQFHRFAESLSGLSELELIGPANEFLATTLVDWAGVAGEDGQALPFSADALDELAPEDVMAFFQALMNLGEAGSGDPLPVTPSAASSGEPPAS